MKNRAVKWIALTMAAAMSISVLAGCGSSESQETAQESSQTATETTDAEDTAAEDTGDVDAAEQTDATAEAVVEEADESTSFTWLIDKQPNTLFYEEYEENPIYRYWSSMGWDADGDGNAKKISVDFTAPPAGSEKDNINTLIATAEYPDVMSLSYSSVSAAELYDEGIALDITEYVESYMPNYMAWMEEHPDFSRMMTNNIDGEDRYIQLYDVNDKAPEMWGGLNYRRDWIVKYGKNPETGEAFTGEWVASENGDDWVDDVVFPSGNTDPIYISDWEWMLAIFAEALEQEGITDGYVMGYPYQGYYPTGDFVSGFGVGPQFYIDEDGVAKFGGDTDAFRAFVECMSTWYANGWIDPAFDEKSGALFFHTDDASVYSGKVGTWYGVGSQMGNVIDTSEGDESNPTNGIVVVGAPQPINDVYGTAAEQNITPFVFFGNSLVGNSVIITEKASKKDIATLCKAIDYLYGQEGGLLRTYGFSDEQQAELQDEFYNAHNLQNGTYDVTVEDGVETYHIHNERDAEDDLAQASMFGRSVGLTVEMNVDHGYPSFKQNGVDQWVRYNDTGYIFGTVTGQFTPDEAQETSQINTEVMTYMSQAVADFVTGRADVTDDSAWEEYCTQVNNYDTQTYVDIVNKVLGN